MDTQTVPKGRGGAREGAGRKAGVAVSADSYQQYNAARAKKEGHLAKLAEFEEKTATGQLVKADDVLKEWQNMITNVRARLLSLPSKLAARAYGARSRGDLQRLLQEGVNEALAELAGGYHEDQ
jgi:septation ring formation regulator EzrA